MNEKDFREVFSDKEFVSNLLQLETGERVRKALAEKGIVLSADELDKFAEVMIESIKKINEDVKSLRKKYIGNADKALYTSKENNKNKTTVY